jgi:hypothetical protein
VLRARSILSRRSFPTQLKRSVCSDRSMEQVLTSQIECERENEGGPCLHVVPNARPSAAKAATRAADVPCPAASTAVSKTPRRVAALSTTPLCPSSTCRSVSLPVRRQRGDPLPNGTPLIDEAESPWQLVEAAWNLDLPSQLLTVSYHARQKLLMMGERRRTAVTGARGALIGCQKGSYFYCYSPSPPMGPART